MLNNYYRLSTALAMLGIFFLLTTCMQADEARIPNLVGEWKGINRTVSAAKGYQEWEKVVTISEQQDNRFRGHFNYSEGTINFSGVIFVDNISFAWVSEDSHGYNMGRILGENRISACYVEAGENATAGCTELVRAAEP